MDPKTNQFLVGHNNGVYVGYLSTRSLDEIPVTGQSFGLANYAFDPSQRLLVGFGSNSLFFADIGRIEDT